MKSNQVSSGAKDKFSPTFNAPKNTAGVRLDFSLDSNGTPMTMEGDLKAAVMRQEMYNNVSAIGSNTVSSIGIGGVGKTCALLFKTTSNVIHSLNHQRGLNPPRISLPGLSARLLNKIKAAKAVIAEFHSGDDFMIQGFESCQFQ
jgi:hypothetical protein